MVLSITCNRYGGIVVANLARALAGILSFMIMVAFSYVFRCFYKIISYKIKSYKSNGQRMNNF